MGIATETTVTAQEFNRAPSKVKARAKDGPVFITEHGTRSFVLLSIEEYEQIKPPERNLADLLRMGDDSLDDVEFGRIGIDGIRDFDLFADE